MEWEGHSMRYVYYSIALSSLVMGFFAPQAFGAGPVNRSPSSISRPELSNAIAQAGSSPVASSGAFLPSGERTTATSKLEQSYPSMQAMQSMADANADLNSFPRNATRVRTQNWDE
jgi:hypothetical protein